MNEFIAAYTVDYIALSNLAADSVAKSINRPSNFVMNHLFSANNSNPLLPAIALCGNTPYCVAEDAANHPWFNSNPIIIWKDNVAWTHGNHTVKFGFYLENYRKNEQFGYDTQGFLSFFGGGTVASGNALADGNHSNGGVNVGCSGSTGFGDPCIGSSGGQLLGTVSGARPARIMQLGLRFIS